MVATGTLCLHVLVLFAFKLQLARGTCGYQACPEPKPGFLNVHVVPHTHDDVGWLKTVDQYYYGGRNNFANRAVVYILDSVIPELVKNPERRFIYVEMAFFWRWWIQQTGEMKDTVKQLVNEGRLEFINGGWCMNDEASTHYNSIIDQMTVGHKFLQDTFGDCARPRASWHIDPFGHSREQASLFAQMYFDGFFLGRADTVDRIIRWVNKDMEQVWHGDQNLGSAADIFYGIFFIAYSSPFGLCNDESCFSPPVQMYFDGWFVGRIDEVDRILRWVKKDMEVVWHGDPNLGSPASDMFFGVLFQGYGAPSGMSYDTGSSSPPVQDDPSLFDENVDNRVTNFAFWAKLQAEFYSTNQIMFTMGGDFNWENAHEWFKNLDKLIKYVNEEENKTGVHAFYSTPTCYLKSLHSANMTWGSKHEDFFPYRDTAHAFWTGYFTSRPALKRYERITNNFLQICKQMEAFGEPNFNGPDNETESAFLKRAMAVAQHHDAVSGTEKQHVADDYALRLHMGTLRCQNLVGKVVQRLTAKTPDKQPPTPQFCSNLNVSICSVTENAKWLAVTIYNPVGRNTTSIVRIPVNGDKYAVNGPNGSLELSQLDAVSDETNRIRGNRGNAKNTLSFIAETPALGYSTYFVQNVAPSSIGGSRTPQRAVFQSEQSRNDVEDIILQNKMVKLTFDGNTGQLKTINDVKNNLSTAITQSFYYYVSSEGDNIVTQSSGAYIFRPNSSDPTPLCDDKLMHFEVVQGDITQEIRQQCTPWLSQVIRVYKDERAAEFEWTVGPIPYKDKIGKEIITRFNTDIKNNATFYTDANGRQILKRVRNQRETWIYLSDDPISGNYYPVNSRIFINDTTGRQLTVLTDRSQGGSSVVDGTMELMIHRRLFHDDSRGVGEALNETGQFGDGLIIRGSHYVLFTSIFEAAKEHRTVGERLYMSPIPMFTENVESNWATSYKVMDSLLARELPANVHLLTLEAWNGTNTLLLRLEHQFEIGEDINLSQSATVSLKGLFTNFDVLSAVEMTLTGNQVKANATRLQWRSLKHPDHVDKPTTPEPAHTDITDIKLTPFQIRTFILTIKRHTFFGSGNL